MGLQTKNMARLWGTVWSPEININLKRSIGRSFAYGESSAAVHVSVLE